MLPKSSFEKKVVAWRVPFRVFAIGSIKADLEAIVRRCMTDTFGLHEESFFKNIS